MKRSLLAFAFSLAVLLPRPVEARTVQQLRTPSGISLWLVEEQGLPLVALRFAMRGGSLEDPPGKDGAGHLLASMLDQGAGPLDASAFQGKLEALGIRLSFSVSRDALSGGFISLSRHVAPTAELLRLAVGEPRLQPADFERVRSQEIAEAVQDAHSPERLAVHLFYQTAFAGHGFARPVRGTAETLARLTATDTQAMRRKLLHRNGMHVVIVGALRAHEAVALVDQIFAGLPQGSIVAAPPSAVLLPISVALPAPDGQLLETAVFALPMPRSGEADHYPALLLTHILGSGNFDARLTQEVRVKRGLAYGISTRLVTDGNASFLLGTVSTQTGTIDAALEVIRATLAMLQHSGPDEREVANAKSSLNGSYLLGVDGNGRLAEHLIGLWLDGVGTAFDEERKAGIDAVTLDDARRAARAFFDPAKLRQIILRPPGRQTK